MTTTTLTLPVPKLRSAPPLQASPPTRSPRPRSEARRELAPPVESSSSRSGLIVITGPSLSGKGMLAHYLNQYLPHSVYVRQTDPFVAELKHEDPQPLSGLLWRIRSQLRCGRKVVFSGRLDSARSRRRVLDVAREVGVPSLLVEVDGTDPATLEHAAEIAETPADVRALLQERRELLPDYRALSATEQRRYKTLTVPADESVEEQIKAVLEGWGRLGSVH